jgi:hemoglobin
MVGWGTGGPQRYTGRSMGDSHRDLKITPQEWEAFLEDFQQTLDKFQVPAAEQAELRAIVRRKPWPTRDSSWSPSIILWTAVRT